MAELDKALAYSRILAFENSMCTRLGRSRMERYVRNWEYYCGDNLPPGNIEQPLSINLLRSINNKHAHYLWGEYADDAIGWRVDPIDEDKSIAEKIINYAYNLIRRTEGNTSLYQAGLNASIYGDAILRLRWDPLSEAISIDNISPEYFHCVWDSTNVNKVLEVIISYPVSRAQANQTWETHGNPSWGGRYSQDALGMAVYWEYWTPYTYQIWIDDICVRDLPNPYLSSSPSGQLLPGIIPIIHIPNMKVAGEFYGFADTENAQALQDELNRKTADEGDIIGNFAHPITIINKYYGDVEELPIGPDQIWDLGREGNAKILSWEGTAPSTHEYLELLQQFILENSAMSQVAFGRHKGTQQSGIALTIEMLPVTERVRLKRLIWNSKLRSMLRMGAMIEERSSSKMEFTSEQLVKHYVRPLWAPILPRDRLALVNENITLVGNKLRTIQRALEDLGEEDTYEQEKDILKQAKELSGIGTKIPASGSSSLPEGASKDTVKGRPMGNNE